MEVPRCKVNLSCSSAKAHGQSKTELDLCSVAEGAHITDDGEVS